MKPRVIGDNCYRTTGAGIRTRGLIMGKDEGGVNGGESSADSELDRQPHRRTAKIMAKRP